MAVRTNCKNLIVGKARSKVCIKRERFCRESALRRYILWHRKNIIECIVTAALRPVSIILSSSACILSFFSSSPSSSLVTRLYSTYR